MGPRLELTPCQLTSPGSPVSLAAECGKLTVPEDRGAANGRNIDLRVAVVRAVSRAPWPDPLFFLTGGPGQAATESFVTIQAAFRRVRRDRDIVLVDQRGTGGSNPLRCPAGDESDVWLLDDEDIEPWVERCLDSLEGDPRFYTTSIAMRDLDDVRRALGHERINLYGVSYGTRAALTYLRLYPDRVRSIVLDGVVPPTETLGIDVARDAERALDLMMGRCSADPSCAKAFPEIGKAVDDVMARLDTPVPISLRHPRTGEIVSVELDRRMAAYAIRLLSYSQETVATIPLLLTSARENDLAPLAAQFLMTVGGVSETMSDAMGISIVCTEDYPFFEDDLIAERSRDTYLGAIQTDALKLVCPSWPRGEVPQGFRAPVKSSVPVLLLSGEADPVTPPENAEIVHSQLDRSLHIVAPGQGHVVIHRGCISSLASNFIEKGTFDGIDTSCVDRIAPRAFFTSFAGPLP
ncbi:MAG TPA: alpha/beta fold hydrolase [Vicinamibacteria bacterium]|nr:alpha/beta fold hydrolase [Vicinamibacteria bacterium]